MQIPFSVIVPHLQLIFIDLFMSAFPKFVQPIYVGPTQFKGKVMNCDFEMKTKDCWKCVHARLQVYICPRSRIYTDRGSTSNVLC